MSLRRCRSSGLKLVGGAILDLVSGHGQFETGCRGPSCTWARRRTLQSSRDTLDESLVEVEPTSFDGWTLDKGESALLAGWSAEWCG